MTCYGNQHDIALSSHNFAAIRGGGRKSLLPPRTVSLLAFLFAIAGGIFAVTPARAATPPSSDPPVAASAGSGGISQDGISQDGIPQDWAIYGQSTLMLQYHPGFGSRTPTGPQSLETGRRGNETFDATLYLGVRLWRGAEFWINPEADQGFGLQNTTGAAGYFSGEAYKVGQRDPYVRLPRAFLRQTVNLGGETEKIEPDLNVLGGSQTANRLVLTAGKFGVTDVFDTNKYAHDPRVDFANWALIDSGAFDYAADAWGSTYGASVEWYRDWWTLRAGLFDLSVTPNSKYLDMRPGHQFEVVVEAEERHTILGQPGKLKLLVYANRGQMVRLVDFTRAVATTGVAPGMASLRRLQTRTGFAVNLEQSLTGDLGMFARLSSSDGRYETFDFTDIDRSVAAGLVLQGTRWARPDDVAGVGIAFNEISRERLNFLRAGGLGVLVGDGKGLPANAGAEQLLEAYYNAAIVKALHVTLDYQILNHPAYNSGRGPVHVFGLRVRAQF